LQIGKFLCHAWLRAQTTVTESAAFHATRIYPLDRSGIPDNAFPFSQISSRIDHSNKSQQRSTSYLQPLWPKSSNGAVQSFMESNRQVQRPLTPNKVFNQVSPYHRYQNSFLQDKTSSSSSYKDGFHLEQEK
jgi:hypothetical protein